MKAIKLSGGVFVLMGLLAALTALPATAQSRWDVPFPAVVVLAKNELLVTVAPPTFTGCVSKTTWELEWLDVMPDVDVLAIFLDDDPAAATWNAHWVPTPAGSYNMSWTSDTWIRVFRLEEGDLESFREDPCGFYSSHPFIAEGLGRWNMHSPDDLLEGPGTNSWGWALQGCLNNNGCCPAGKSPRLFWLQNWVTHSTDILTAKTAAQRGPTLTCK